MTTVTSPGTTYTGSVTTGATAQDVTFDRRFGYVNVVNLSTDTLWVTADGSTPTGDDTYTGNGQVAVPAGESRLVANGLPIWYQTSNVIPAGSISYGGGNTSATPGAPGMVTPMASLAGQMTNPGTKITILGATTGDVFSLEGTG